ncbi:membrane-bound lytic murein transglycosylase A [Andreprevotia lacus DSM 23236]|uniref:peptidoglycan lytic exotransglycosylase n=1 Tax=Andreprevotia lacus DSM 23236 TaxID=1121001 RepID=A0A1W1XDF8_9NEIS|nr:MltA domain-containing protein [Andreprevotia lacus]SMC21910.1 membrane-bound lytic murein transglycosylase A [Andreprevotia lacus DSM 23236]
MKYPAFLAAALLGLAACTTPPTIPKTETTGPRYTEASWASLPALNEADWLAGFNAWRKGCSVLGKQAIWASVCRDAAQVPQQAQAARAFLQQRLRPVSLRNPDGGDQGLITGYYEPVYPGSLTRTANATIPVYGIPNDLITVQLDSLFPELKGKRVRGRLVGQKLLPYPSAADIAQDGLTAPVLAWLESPMDLQFLQIQGSGRVRLADGKEIRLGYADQNGHPYSAIGKWLIAQGELTAPDVSMQSIRAWALSHPARMQELLASNPSYVFFRTLPAGNDGPPGSLGVPLTAGYSLAVDTRHVPPGSPMLIATTTPDGATLNRLAAAQDTGGAITGQVRADFFFGKGDAAGELAGKMKQRGRLWLLWPQDAALPNPQSAQN